MSISEEIKFNTLYDHYKASTDVGNSFRASRNRAFLLVLLILVLLVVFGPRMTTAVDLAASLTGNPATNASREAVQAADPAALNIVAWFALLSSLVIYYRMSVLAHRNYRYVAQLELRLSQMVGDCTWISREGLAFASDTGVCVCSSPPCSGTCLLCDRARSGKLFDPPRKLFDGVNLLDFCFAKLFPLVGLAVVGYVMYRDLPTEGWKWPEAVAYGITAFSAVTFVCMLFLWGWRRQWGARVD